MPQSTGLNRQILLAARPVGAPAASDVKLVESAVPSPGPGQMLLRNGWMSDAKSYAEPTEIAMTPATETLDKSGTAYSLHRYDHDPKTESYGSEAADKLGLNPGQVFKTLLACTVSGELLVAVVPVNGQLDLKLLARAALAKKVSMADPVAAQRSTGYLLGGISPLGQKKALRTFIDSSAQSWSQIYISAGRRGLELALSPADLAQQTRAHFAPIGRPT